MIGKLGLGWRPEMPDFRDEEYSFKAKLSATATPVAALPDFAMAIWNKGKRPDPAFDYPVFDQGALNSCTGNAGATMMGLISGLSIRSRLHLYFEARRLINETDKDEGAYIRDIVKVLSTLGAGSEGYWKYVEKNVLVDPPLREDRDAAKHIPLSYHRLSTANDYRQCLADGFPFEIGIAVYDNFMSDTTASTGIVPLPLRTEKPQGGHAVCVIGYDLKFRDSEWAKTMVAAGFPADQVPEAVYIVRNSWGAAWGHKGNFAIDVNYIQNGNLADDAWTIRMK